MLVSTAYTPLCTARHRSPENAGFYIMNSLLYSRMEAGFPTNDDFFDEDVNVYLAGLLTAMIYENRPKAAPSEEDRGAGHRVSGGLANPPAIGTAPSDAALFERAESAATAREKYELYKAHADGILISLGVFRKSPGGRPGPARHYSLSDAAFAGRGMIYYSIAQSLATRLSRKNTAVTDVLGKLSRGFDRYVKVLSLMSGEYFNLIRRISTGELYHLEHAALAPERRVDLKLHYDRFLDIYSIYLRKKSQGAKKALMTAAREIRTLDPSFSFNIED
jgi:hypothetical protein